MVIETHVKYVSAREKLKGPKDSQTKRIKKVKQINNCEFMK